MNSLKNKVITLIALSMFSSISFADYTVKIPLDSLKINTETIHLIDGDATLSNYTINRGESSNIIWNYQYADQVNISNLGVYSSSGSESVSPLRTTTYTVNATNATDSASKTLTLNVIQPIPTISFSADKTQISAGQPVNLNWLVINAENVDISNIGSDLDMLSNQTVFPTENTTYTLTARGYESSGDISRSVSIDVFANSIINTFTGPNSVFINEPFDLNWSGNNIIKYMIKSNNSNSGLATTETDIGSSTSRTVTPTIAGSYIYTLEGYNEVDNKTTLTKSVSVESLPTFTGFTVNGETTINVAPGAALTFLGSGFSSGATLQGRNSTNTTDVALPINAPTNVSSNTYYANVTKTLNGVKKFSANRSVLVTVVETWVDTTPTYSEWTNSGDVYGCTNWTPSASTVPTTQTVDQTATDCSQDQTRTMQNREIETTTGAIRNKGTPVSESNVITVSSMRTVNGTLIAKECLYGSSTYYWKLGGVVGPGMTVIEGSKNTLIYWNSTTVYTVGGWTSNPLTVGSFKYTRSTLKSNTSPGNQLYEVCRESI